jgi:predicted oxidoreductase
MTLSALVAGTWRLAERGWSAAETLRWIEQAADRGVTSFDHADIYGGYRVEALFGEALAHAPGLRERLQLVSKCGIRLTGHERGAARIKHYDTSRAHIVASVEQSLRALRTDRLDLLLLHRPDPLMDAAEVAATIAGLKQAGKVLAFGVSNFEPRGFELLDSLTPLATNQIELHPLRREPLHDGTLDQLQQRGRRPMVWSPLAGGRLLGGDESPAAQRVRWVLGDIGARLGVAPATVAYAWLLRHPTRPHPIVGSMRLEGLLEARAALELNLDAETWTELWQAGAGQPVA